MGTFDTETGMYVPEFGESGLTWAGPVSNDLELLKVPAAGRVQELNPPVVYLSSPSLTPAASDTDRDRGNRLLPYASPKQIFDELTGLATAGPNVSQFRPLDIRILPGPEFDFPIPPAGGFSPSQTFPGQTFRLPDDYWFQLPEGCRIYGDCSEDIENNEQNYRSLIYGNRDGALLRLGNGPGTSYKSTSAGLDHVGVLNLGGDGVEVRTDVHGAFFRYCSICFNKRTGVVVSRHAMDTFVLDHVDVLDNAQGGTGYGLDIGSASGGPANLITIFGGISKRNGPNRAIGTNVIQGTGTTVAGGTTLTRLTGTFDAMLEPVGDCYAYLSVAGAGVGGSWWHGRVIDIPDANHMTVSPAFSTTVTSGAGGAAWSGFPSTWGGLRAQADFPGGGSAGLSVLLLQHRFDTHGNFFNGVKGYTIQGGYTEGAGDFPWIIVDSYGNGVPGDSLSEAGRAKSITFRGMYPHGGDGLDGWGSALTVLGGKSVRWYENVGVGNPHTATKPTVWFDDGLSKVCYVSIDNEIGGGGGDDSSGVTGKNYCHIGNAGSAHNRGEYYDTSLGKMMDYPDPS